MHSFQIDIGNQPQDTHSIDEALIAGDYCFSNSDIMPRLRDIFFKIDALVQLYEPASLDWRCRLKLEMQAQVGDAGLSKELDWMLKAYDSYKSA